jgi:hypothetical protein
MVLTSLNHKMGMIAFDLNDCAMHSIWCLYQTESVLLPPGLPAPREAEDRDY